jgi:hypothetical protein
LNDGLGFHEYKLIQGLFFFKHVKLDVIKSAWGESETFVELDEVIFGTSENVDILDLPRSSLHKILGKTQERAEGHKVFHRVEHWGPRHNPLDGSLQTANILENLGTFVPDFVGFIENDSIPATFV